MRASLMRPVPRNRARALQFAIDLGHGRVVAHVPGPRCLEGFLQGGKIADLIDMEQFPALLVRRAAARYLIGAQQGPASVADALGIGLHLSQVATIEELDAPAPMYGVADLVLFHHRFSLA